MGDDPGALAVIVYLYFVGWCWTYSLAPLWLPITCKGPTFQRFVIAILWPIVGLLGVLGIGLAGFK